MKNSDSPKPIWIPSDERVKNSNMTAYMKFLRTNFNKEFKDYNELYNWSISDIDGYWKSIWKFSGIVASKNYDKVVSSNAMLETKWFEGSKLNFAENLLRYKDDKTAIISAREDYSNIRITYEELFSYVASCSEYLKSIGIKSGDRIAGFVSNIPEAIIAMLSATSLGAIWSSCSPDFGIQGIIDRFGQIQPEVFFAVESYQYNGKKINCLEKIEKVVSEIKSIKKVILIDSSFNFIKSRVNAKSTSYENRKFVYFKEIIFSNSLKIDFAQNSFDHPVYIVYSSGTTGKPKCIVHGAGGTLLQHFKELSLHTNLNRNDTITYYTTCGWMMWNWLISSLFLGATIFIYDGNPVYPNINLFWEKIQKEKISIFGTSPKYLSICQRSNLIPCKNFDLTSLKTILSTGSPLSKENFQYIYSSVKNDVQLSSISGGTDIISCFVLGNPNLPVYEGEIQCRGLGMKVEVFDEKGNSIINEKGELVCTKPFPSMPIYFWNDPEKKKYNEAYFNYYHGIWRHGDFVKITETGGVIIFGRSDATLNPGGIRIGTAEIYRAVESLEEVTDSLVIGQSYENDVRIILFVSLSDGKILSEKLTERIKERISIYATRRHIPSKIFQITEVPRTLNGKKVEIAVSKIINGETIDNRDTLANPNSLTQFEKLKSLLTN